MTRTVARRLRSTSLRPGLPLTTSKVQRSRGCPRRAVSAAWNVAASASVRASASRSAPTTCTKRTARWRVTASWTAARATGSADPSLTSPAITSPAVLRPAVSCSVVSVVMPEGSSPCTSPAQGRTSRSGRLRVGGGRSALTGVAAPPYRPEGAPRGCRSEEDAMRALVYHGPGNEGVGGGPEARPSQADTDAIVRVDAVTICGTDLHILKGDVPAVTDGRILGHEAVGTVEAGRRGRQERQGRATACSSRASPRAARAASAARAATASASAAAAGSSATRSTARRPSTCGCRSPTPRPTAVPAGVTDEEVLMLADILPDRLRGRACSTAHVRPGDVVAVVGAGPDRPVGDHGRPAVQPGHIVAIDLADSPARGGQAVRRRRRRQHRARGRRSRSSATSPTVSAPTSPSRRSACPATFELCAPLVRPGGHVANIGVHGEPATLHLEDLWIRNVTITTGLVDTYSTPTLLKLLARAASSTSAGSSPTTSPWTSSCRPTTCSRAPPRPAPSRSS